MKPTVQNPDFYAVGNDYAQAPISAYYDTSRKITAEEAIKMGNSALEGEIYDYQDGIYTRLAKDLVNGQFSADPWKDPNGFNKRTILVNPSASYADADYGQADVIFDGKGDEDDYAASATFGTNDQFIKPDAPSAAKAE